MAVATTSCPPSTPCGSCRTCCQPSTRTLGWAAYCNQHHPIHRHPYQVSPKVLGGADLFLQGVIVPPEGAPALRANDVCSIAIPDNARHCFAIGTMHVSTADAAASGWKGKGVRLLHVLGDALWAMGDKAMPHPSVTLTQIFPMEEEDVAVIEDVGQLAIVDDPEAQLHGDTEGVSGDEPVAPAAVAGPAEMDALLESTLLRALVAMPDSALPILPSDLYARFMLPNRPAGVLVVVVLR